MPQLDKVHFLSQFFWLCVFYFIFYYYLSKHFLPRIARILQFRKRKFFSNDSLENSGEFERIQKRTNSLLQLIFPIPGEFWAKTEKKKKEWNERITQPNSQPLDSFKNPSVMYLEKVGDLSLTQNMATGGSQGAGNCHPWRLLQQLQMENILSSKLVSSTVSKGKPYKDTSTLLQKDNDVEKKEKDSQKGQKNKRKR